RRQNEMPRTIEGYAAYWLAWSNHRVPDPRSQLPDGRGFERFGRNAFEWGDDLHARLNHDKRKVIASVRDGSLIVWNDPHGLPYRIRCDLPREPLAGVSVGVEIIEDQQEQIGYLIKRAKLFELSLVTEPNNPVYTSTALSLRVDGQPYRRRKYA